MKDKGKNRRIVIDTNLWISFILTKDFSKLNKILRDQSVVLLFNEELLQEFIDVASRPKFIKYFSKYDLADLLDQIDRRAEFVKTTTVVDKCRDPKDNFLLSLAIDGKATHIISGDKDLLIIKEFKGVKIVSISEYHEEKKSC